MIYICTNGYSLPPIGQNHDRYFYWSAVRNGDHLYIYLCIIYTRGRVSYQFHIRRCYPATGSASRYGFVTDHVYTEIPRRRSTQKSTDKSKYVGDGCRYRAFQHYIYMCERLRYKPLSVSRPCIFEPVLLLDAGNGRALEPHDVA